MTYCIAEFSDAALGDAVRNALDEITWEYELVGDINFVHRTELDGAACNNNAAVAFFVRQGGEEAGDCG